MDSKNEKVLNQNGKLPLREKHIYIYIWRQMWRLAKAKIEIKREH